MKLNTDILYEIFSGLKAEKKEIQDLLDKNLLRIAELERIITSVHENTNKKEDIFSPRNKEKVKSEVIQQYQEEITKLEYDNRNHYKDLNNLSTYLAGLESLLNVEPINRNLYVLDIQEKERQRIARDLHDTSLQNLAHLVHKIELSSMFIDQDPLRAKLELAAVNKNLKTVINDIRGTVFDLRPMTFDDLGICEAFNRLLLKLKESNAIDFVTDIQEIDYHNNLVLVTMFRVVQECCNNAIKHSGCNRIILNIHQEENNCHIYIEDNGSGFNIEDRNIDHEKHFGLHIIRERVELLGGNISFDSNSEGTRITIVIPMI